MRRRLAPTLAALACGLALACGQRSDTGTNPGGGAGGVRAGGAEGAEAVARALNDFTDELLAKVESAPETKAGVAEAQALLDARRGELAGRLAALRRGAQDPASKGRLLEAEVDNTDRVHRLQLKYADAAARDPGLKAGLERLIDDYDALFR